jgi:hypothetical protein
MMARALWGSPFPLRGTVHGPGCHQAQLFIGYQLIFSSSGPNGENMLIFDA